MLYMVIEHFRNQDARAVYDRFNNSWVSADLGRCFQIMECDDLTLLQRWAVEWSDLVEFEIIPVSPGKDVAEALRT